MRRWIGALCYELHRGQLENYDCSNIDPDCNRQQFGRLIVEEPDKLVKIICAEIVKDLCNKGARAEDLFPLDYDKLVYSNFLLAIQEEKSWYHSFQRYLHNISMKIDGYQEQVDKLLSLTSIVLNPYYSFNCGDQINYMALNDQLITILVPPTATRITQFIEISLVSISKLRNIIEKEKFMPISTTYEIQFKEGPGNPILFNGKPVHLINTRLQLSAQDGKILEDYLVGLLPVIDVEVNADLDRIPESQELPVSYLNTNCSSCEILIRKGKHFFKTRSLLTNHKVTEYQGFWANKFLDQNNRSLNIETTDEIKNSLSPRSKTQENLVNFIDRNQMMVNSNATHEATKPKAKQPLVTSRRSIGDFQGCRSNNKSRILKKTSEVRNILDFNGQDKVSTNIRASDSLTALPTPASNVKPQLNISEGISLPIIIKEKILPSETGIINHRQAAVTHNDLSLSKKTQKNNCVMFKKIKKTGKQKSSPNKTKNNMKSKSGQILAGKKQKLEIKSVRISAEPSPSLRISFPSGQKLGTTTTGNGNKNKSIKEHIIQLPNSASDRNILQRDATTLGFVAEQPFHDQEIFDYYSASSKASIQIPKESISKEGELLITKENSNFQEELSPLLKYDMTLVKGINSMMDEINNHSLSPRKRCLHTGTPQIPELQSTISKCKGKPELKSQDTNNSLGLVLSTENIQMESLIPKATIKEFPLTVLAQKQISEDDIAQLSDTIDFSPNMISSREKNCKALDSKSKSIRSKYSNNFTTPEPQNESFTTQIPKFVFLDSNKKRSSSYEDKVPRKKYKHNLRADPGLTKNDFSGISNSRIRQTKDLTQIEYNKTTKVLSCNSFRLTEKQNKNLVSPNYYLEQDTPNTEFTRKPKLISFEPIQVNNQGNLCQSNHTLGQPKEIKRSFHKNKNKNLLEKPLNKTTLAEICKDSHNTSTGTSINNSNNVINDFSLQDPSTPVTIDNLIINTSSAFKKLKPGEDISKHILKISTPSTYHRTDITSSYKGLKVTDEGSPISKKDILNIYERSPETKIGQFRNKKKEQNIAFADRKIPDSFKSRIPLAKKLRAEPLLPKTSKSNIALYETIDDIDFTDIGSREVISQKMMHDPFSTQDSKLQRQNPFLKLLQGTITNNSNPIGSRSDQASINKPTKSSHPSTFKISDKNESPDGSSAKIKQRNDTWNEAIRTRYEGLYDSIHGIADDLITRLVKEEDRMRLLIDQYSRNSSKIINYLSTYRGEEQALILKRLENAKANILNNESKALKSLTKIHSNLQGHSIIDTVTVWEEKKSRIRAMINDNKS
ncbi:putative powdery mildew-specific protein [Erysiphe necator]|uniref:Putative powdery mildew-specific protein n=1 Tax=Uncinula necator TaxID=52586 RepID=A0A0B1P9L5_UNCNE|nr:putative powdery mildew-specific protein [Erysiphe necator]